MEKCEEYQKIVTRKIKSTADEEMLEKLKLLYWPFLSEQTFRNDKLLNQWFNENLEIVTAFHQKWDIFWNKLDEAAQCHFCYWDDTNPKAVANLYMGLYPLRRYMKDYLDFHLKQGNITEAIADIRRMIELMNHLQNGNIQNKSFRTLALLLRGEIHRSLLKVLIQHDAPNLLWACRQLPLDKLGDTAMFNSDDIPVPKDFNVSPIEAISDEKARQLYDFFAKRVCNDQKESDALLASLRLIALKQLKTWNCSPKNFDKLTDHELVLLFLLGERTHVIEQKKILYLQIIDSPKNGVLEQNMEKNYFKRIEKMTSDKNTIEFLKAVCFEDNLEIPTSTSSIVFLELNMRAKAACEIIIEAIRWQTAKNGDCKLPKNLKDINVVPLPNNPFTNKPFDYNCKDDGGSAILSYQYQDDLHESHLFNYEIKIRTIK